jgi:5-methylcytosine-specific restriction endonuclease McrA
MLSICPICGDEFNAQRAQKYCTVKCRGKAKELRKEPVLKMCLGCGIQFKPSGQNQKYHNEKCRKEKYYSHMVENVMKFRDKTMFGGNRELALQRDGYKCTVCGGTKQLGVHHKDRTGQTDNPNHEMDNLISLCNKCHIHEHLGDLSKPRTAFDTTCQECGKLFKTTPFRISIGAGTFCSAKCRDVANVKLTSEQQEELQHSLIKPNWIVVKCANPFCDVEFEVPPYRVKRSLDKHGELVLYHCLACRTATENHKRAKPKPEKPIKPKPREGYKFCIKCGEELPANESFFHKRVDNGVEKLKNTCKKCANLISSK